MRTQGVAHPLLYLACMDESTKLDIQVQDSCVRSIFVLGLLGAMTLEHANREWSECRDIT